MRNETSVYGLLIICQVSHRSAPAVRLDGYFRKVKNIAIPLNFDTLHIGNALLLRPRIAMVVP